MYLAGNIAPNRFTISLGRQHLNIKRFMSTFSFTEGIHLPRWKTPSQDRHNAFQCEELDKIHFMSATTIGRQGNFLSSRCSKMAKTIVFQS